MTAEARAAVHTAASGRRGESKGIATTSTFSIPEDLFAQASHRFEQAHPGQRATSQSIIGWAVEAHLEALKDAVCRLGFRNRPLGKPKPRRISQRALAELKLASSESGISTAALLRACLEAAH
jgi:hypothetical protein